MSLGVLIVGDEQEITVQGPCTFARQVEGDVPSRLSSHIGNEACLSIRPFSYNAIRRRYMAAENPPST